jgi:phosphoribosyl 1,2-cyclic phosphodiesterase
MRLRGVRLAKPLRLLSLTSGSQGNCTWVGDDHAGVLIDCGGSNMRLQQGLEAAGGLERHPIDSILITHEHIDHVGGVGVVQRALAGRGCMPDVWATRGTWEGSKNLERGKIRCQEVIERSVFFVKHLKIEAIPVPHDTREPVCFLVSNSHSTAMVCTDLGRATSVIRERLKEVEILVMEFNHDPEMLLNSEYPSSVRTRIRGDYGHLSNEQAYRLLVGNTPSLRHLVVGHISNSTNTHELARKYAELAREHSGQSYSITLARSREAIPSISAF